MTDLSKLSDKDLIYAHGAAAFRAGGRLKSKTDWQDREKLCATELLSRLSELDRLRIQYDALIRDKKLHEVEMEALKKRVEDAPHGCCKYPD